jgi:hypothetical protein
VPLVLSAMCSACDPIAAFRSSEMESCTPESPRCSPTRLASLTAQELLKLPSPLHIECEFVPAVTSSYETKCRDDIYAALVSLSDRHAVPSRPSSPAALTLIPGALAIDPLGDSRMKPSTMEFLYMEVSTR